jgi:DNA-binding transcriptional MocR family regulator
LLEAPTATSDLSANVPLSGIDPDPAAVLHRLADRPDRRALFRYHPPTGMRRHRVAGCTWLARMGVEAKVEDVLLCAGAQHALFVILSHLSPRSNALYVEELSYPGIHGIAEVLRMPIVPVAMDAEGMSVGALERAHRRNGPGVVYCMPTIHNPTGAVMQRARREALATLARARDLFIVEDAANRMLLESAPPPILRFAPERTFLVASVSKVLTPGLRIAFSVGPPGELGALSRLAWATQWMVSPLGAELVAMWLEDGTVERTLKLKRREARRRQALVRRILGKRGLSAHEDALHVWLRLEAKWQVDRFVSEASKQNIVVTPSSAFWMRKTAPPSAIRLSLGGVDDAGALAAGLARIGAIRTSLKHGS